MRRYPAASAAARSARRDGALPDAALASGAPPDSAPPASADVVVIGAGMVGAAVAAHLARSGRRVCVVDRTTPLGGTTAAGEGNILVSDKLPGPEMTLALRSNVLWREFAAERGEQFEFEPKGGLVVAQDPAQLEALHEQAGRQRAAGAEVTVMDVADLRSAEPHLSPRLAGGAFYPQDCQVQPMRAAMSHLAEARDRGCVVVADAEARGLERTRTGAVAALATSRGRVAAPVVVNAAGPWSAEVARRLGSGLPVRPRRGHILVTEPLPQVIRHKVYEADYVGAVVSDDDALACSAVVEGTASGTVLIGSSRDFAGLSARLDISVLAEIARRVISLFPFLAGVRAVRAYRGFRPATPDHLPIIGADATVPGLFHATGHEGAGIGLAPATAEIIAALVDGKNPPVDPAPFAPARFVGLSHKSPRP
ncbi:MAG: NAD(P)/FAD-dependent oxidoreductase [Micromonosporaceae bacterium]